ncbi:MAG: glycosyltransferase, partial [Planctomycetota bacterium]
MRIVHIITRLILGGAQENTLITCKLLAERGHDVTLVTGPAIGPEGELFNQTKDQKYKVITLPYMIRAIAPFRDLISYRQLKYVIEKLRPDVVHTHSAKAGILGRYAAYKVRGKNRTPTIIHTIHGLAFHKYQSELLNKLYISIEKKAAMKTD